MIEIRRMAGTPLAFAVTIRDGKSQTRHRVTLSDATLARLGGGSHTPEQYMDAAFRFLLDREAKEAILARFDISEIARYFPKFERELPRYLAQS